jgi:hypothetical protein
MRGWRKAVRGRGGRKEIIILHAQQRGVNNTNETLEEFKKEQEERHKEQEERHKELLRVIGTKN